jgi:type VI secretion system protein VasJ
MDMLSLGSNPITPEQPAGSDVRYESEFEELQAEIDKLSSPTASGGVDWAKVSRLASLILEKKSKDILVAGYLAVSQINIAQIDGLLTGLHVYRDLVEHFWEDLFPAKKRMRGRIAAIQWWIEKSETALKQLAAGTVPSEQMDDILETLQAIDSFLREHLEEPISIGPVQRTVLDKFSAQAAEKSEPEKEIQEPKNEPAVAASPERKTEIPQPTQASEGIESEKDAQRVMRTGLQELRKVSSYLLDSSPENALSYRCTRITAWSLVESVPPNENGKTRIPPPDNNTIKILYDLYDKQDWEALLKSAERRINQFIFCLDLNRLAAQALDGLGNRYASAHETVCQETAFFVHRLPGLVDLTFSDGTPFADQSTRDWLKLIGFGSGSVSIDPLPAQSAQAGSGEYEMVEKIGKAKTLAGKKKLIEAVDMLQEELLKSVSEKEKLLWRLALAEVLIFSKQIEMALPHLEAIRRTAEMYRLEDWEPDLALRAMIMVWKGFSMHPSDVSQNTCGDALNRIAKLSPKQALLLVKK